MTSICFPASVPFFSFGDHSNTSPSSHNKPIPLNLIQPQLQLQHSKILKMSFSAAAIPIATVPDNPITTQHVKSTEVTAPSAGVEPDQEPATHAPVEMQKGGSSVLLVQDQTEPIDDGKQEPGDTLERSILGRKLLQTVQALKEAMCSILEEEDDLISPKLERQIGKIQRIRRELEDGTTS